MEAESVECPNCGKAFDQQSLRRGQCRACATAIVVTSLSYLERYDQPVVKKYILHYTRVLRERADDPDALLALALCYMRLNLFGPCDGYLKKMLEHHPAEAGGYYYSAIALLRGKRPRLTTMDGIRNMLSLLDTAAELDPGNGRYEICKAIVVYDYYVTNGMRVPEPAPGTLLQSASEKTIDGPEVVHLLGILRIPDGPLRDGCLQLAGQ